MAMRQARVFDRHLQSFPEEEEGIGWSGAGGSDLRVLVGRVDFLRDWTNQEIRKVRRGIEGGGRPERGGGVHHRRRIRRGIATVSADLRRRIRRLGVGLREKGEKEAREESLGVL
jgi:hypothetical protein